MKIQLSMSAKPKVVLKPKTLKVLETLQTFSDSPKKPSDIRELISSLGESSQWLKTGLPSLRVNSIELTGKASRMEFDINNNRNACIISKNTLVYFEGALPKIAVLTKAEYNLIMERANKLLTKAPSASALR